MKSIMSSKRLWTGVIALITGISMMLTGEKTWEAVAPELLMTGIGLVQTIIALTSKATLTVGGKAIN